MSLKSAKVEALVLWLHKLQASTYLTLTMCAHVFLYSKRIQDISLILQCWVRAKLVAQNDTAFGFFGEASPQILGIDGVTLYETHSAFEI